MGTRSCDKGLAEGHHLDEDGNCCQCQQDDLARWGLEERSKRQRLEVELAKVLGVKVAELRALSAEDHEALHYAAVNRRGGI